MGKARILLAALFLGLAAAAPGAVSAHGWFDAPGAPGTDDQSGLTTAVAAALAAAGITTPPGEPAVAPVVAPGTTARPEPGRPQRGAAQQTTASISAVTASEVLPTDDPLALTLAMVTDPAVVAGASFVTKPPLGFPTAVSTTPLVGFPRHGPSYTIMTTGDARLADQPNNAGNSGEDIGGGNVRGDTDLDVTILRVDLRVPAGVNCMTGLDFRFLSDEFPEFVGSEFNDAFIAELDRSTWTTQGSTIVAPDNFAFDPVGNVISINAAGRTSMSAEEAAGTTYDGATPLLTARVPITPGDHSLYLSIFDQGDHILDSAVFLDRLQLGRVGNVETQCRPGATVVEPSLEPADGSEGEWIPLTLELGGADPEAPVTWTAVPGPGVDPGASCRFSDSPPEPGPMNVLGDLFSRLGDVLPGTPDEASGAQTFMRCTDDGVWVVTATVEDGSDQPPSTSAEVTVRNAPPTVIIDAPETGTRIPLGQPVEVSVLYFDPGSNDTHTCVIDWGDGSSSEGEIFAAGGAGVCTASHTYAALGQYVITAHVVDDDTLPSGESRSVAEERTASVAPATVTVVPGDAVPEARPRTSTTLPEPEIPTTLPELATSQPEAPTVEAPDDVEQLVTGIDDLPTQVPPRGRRGR